MTTPFPGFDFYAPAQATARTGLYDAAAQVIDVPGVEPRIAGGVIIWPTNCGPSGTWPTDICPPPYVTEQQTITITGQSAGTFTASGSDPIAWDADAAEIEAALNAVPAIAAAGGVVVSGGPLPGTVTVDWNLYGNQPTISLNTAGLTGTIVSNVATVRAGTGNPKGGDRPDNSENFLPVNAWGWDECGHLGMNGDNEERARQVLAINEPLYVESAFADRILLDAGAPAVAVSIVDAIAALEANLAENGINGVIHASPYWTAVAFAVDMIRWVGSKLQTQLGTAWAAGNGYVGPLENTLVATGQVFIWKGAITVAEAIDWRHNRKVALAERTVLAAYEPCHVSAITVPALINGGGSGGGSGLVYPSP